MALPSARAPARHADARPTGSEFERNKALGWTTPGELDPGFVHMVFYGSVTVFTRDRRDCVWRPRDTAPVESSLVVLPRVLPEAKVDWFTRVFENSIYKSAQDSTWLVERDCGVDAYCERGLQSRRILKLLRLREHEAAEKAWRAGQITQQTQKEAAQAPPAAQEANSKPDPPPKRQKLA